MKDFRELLDRYGTDINQWPANLAEEARSYLLTSAQAEKSYRNLVQIEEWIAASRPMVAPDSVRRVVNRAALAIRRDHARPSLVDRLLVLLAAPVPRVAFAMILTAVGFGIGFALGTPDDVFATPQGGPLLTASADDGLF